MNMSSTSHHTHTHTQLNNSLRRFSTPSSELPDNHPQPVKLQEHVVYGKPEEISCIEFNWQYSVYQLSSK